MPDKTLIQWTDATWNPVRGCTRVSPGCGGPGKAGGCYAETIAARFSGPGQPFHGFAERTANGGRWTGKLALVEEALTLPLRWRKPRRIFVNSMSDLFHESLPDEAIDRVFAVMALAPQHTFQVLTKRAKRMQAYATHPERSRAIAREFLKMWGIDGIFKKNWITDDTFPLLEDRADDAPLLKHWPLPNVWLGVSAEDQQRADERVPHLLNTPAAVRFESPELLLEAIDFSVLQPSDPPAEFAPLQPQQIGSDPAYKGSRFDPNAPSCGDGGE